MSLMLAQPLAFDVFLHGLLHRLSESENRNGQIERVHIFRDGEITAGCQRERESARARERERERPSERKTTNCPRERTSPIPTRSPRMQRERETRFVRFERRETCLGMRPVQVSERVREQKPVKETTRQIGAVIGLCWFPSRRARMQGLGFRVACGAHAVTPARYRRRVTGNACAFCHTWWQNCYHV